MSLGSTLKLRCPQCFENMGVFDPLDATARPVCAQCGFVLLNSKGIWEALAPDREEHFRQFIREYQTVRAKEGRGSSGPNFYLALPYADLTGRNRWQWAIRARSYRCFESDPLAHLELERSRGMKVLDIGAGSGWLSYRLALRGHRPVAVDLLDNDKDGLGAARHYLPSLPKPFARFRAEMDRLPFAESQFDFAIFNASFHYSENYQRTLEETLRCLCRPGDVIILDSPFYTHDESGCQMVQERQAEFQKKYGFPSNSIPSREYLTKGILDDLARVCGLNWKILKPWYGLGWTLRPVKARLGGRRQPASFYLLWGRGLNS